MAKFKVGDRVIAHTPVGGMKLKDEIGVIVETDTLSYCIEFDNNVRGHDGEYCGRRHKDGHCWWVDSKYLELVTPSATPIPDKYPRNCKVRLVAYNAGEQLFTIGKVYEVKDNCISNDRGYKYDYSRSDKAVLKYLSNWYKFEVVEDDTKPIPAEVKAEVKVEVKVTIDIYANACFYCRKGGLVDRYLAGSLATCPACGRLCNSQTPTARKVEAGVSIPCSGEEDDNEPLTTEELRQMDGQEVWCSSIHGGEERFVDTDGDEYCGWYIVVAAQEQLIHTKGGWNKYGFCANGDDWGFFAYRREPKHD